MPSGLALEYLRVVGKGLALDRISCWVAKEHRPLFAYLACEAEVGLDDKGQRVSLESLCKLMKVIDRENEAEMGNRYVVPVDCIVGTFGSPSNPVGDNLMSIEIPVDPVFVGPSARTAKNLSIKVCRRVEICYA